MQKILVATNNPSKIRRLRQLVGSEVEFLSPSDLGIGIVEIEEGSDLDANAEQKARAYFGKTDLPILGMDSAFVIPGEDLDPARVKRNALVGLNESTLAPEEIARRMVEFYGQIAKRHGGFVPVERVDAFALLRPDGALTRERSTRTMRLTDKVVGPVDSHFPLRSMYIVEPIGKYANELTPEEESQDLEPYADAVRRVVG
jgi:hypothetical protein